jgi:hypothetical protein
MFVCDHPALMEIREIFLVKLYSQLPDIQGTFPSALDFFRGILPRREIAPLLAKLAFDTLKIYDAVEILRVEPPDS